MNNFKIDNPYTIVDTTEAKLSHLDMQLMSLCKHNIIANSSYSWWGAWLNNNANKIVMAPKQWYVDNEKNKLSMNIVPKTWIKI
jgi:hypothetical protein